MLAVDSRPAPSQVSTPRAQFWCEAVAVEDRGDRGWWLGARTAASPRGAVRWMRAQVQLIAVQLAVPANSPAWQWLNSPYAHEQTLRRLLMGEWCACSVWAEEDGQWYRYVVSTRPVPQPEIAGARLRGLP